MMAQIRFGPPLKLYDLCIKAAIADYNSTCEVYSKDFRILPSTALLDFYEKLFYAGKYDILITEIADLDIFSRLLHVKRKQSFLIRCYHMAIERTDMNITVQLLKTFNKWVKDEVQRDKMLIDIGMNMGNFLNDCGLFAYSNIVLSVTISIIQKAENVTIQSLLNQLESYKLKIYASCHYYQFDKARAAMNSAQQMIDKLVELGCASNFAAIYAHFSLYYFMYSEYNESYVWAKKALSLVTSDLTKRDLIDVLRQASKSCVVKREFLQAGLLIRQAMNLAEILFDKDQHPCFTNVLMDYGFYLLNSDAIAESVSVYDQALSMRRNIFCGDNLYLAMGHEDLAYALYVNEYSSGNFNQAKEHAEKSINMMIKIVPSDNLMLASVKRVKALILEEMALDEGANEKYRKELLNTAETLHITALKLARDNFGEKNVQTAKHYGNLGRLYQSMKEYNEAERMHLKAIAIKEELLGKDDYEVGLSIGHLASLYNYHMKKFKEAEALYLRSIEINVKLFGSAYSGLEYDYRGLIHIYHELVDPDKCLDYRIKMTDWKRLRERISVAKYKEQLLPPKEIVNKFFEFARSNIDRKTRDDDDGIANIAQSDSRENENRHQNGQVKDGRL